MAKVVVLEDQSIFDLALQVCGSIEAVFSLAGLNGLSITDSLYPGLLMVTPNIANDANLIASGVNKPVKDYYSINNIRPATDKISEYTQAEDDGIDFMAIEVDNIVT